MPTITVRDFTFTYAHQSTPILKNVNLTFPANQISLIAGPSGTGKSTLLKSIAKLYPAFVDGDYTGTITIGTQPVDTIQPSALSGIVAMLFQNPNQQFTMTTVIDELQFALENRRIDPQLIPGKIDAALTFVEIQKLKSRKLNTLSGGEKQKVALAIIIAMDADVILLDEPFASLDRKSRADLLHQLTHLRDQKAKTIIIVDHDLAGYQGVVDAFFYLPAHQLQIQRLTPAEVADLLVPFDQHELIAVRYPLPTAAQPAALTLTNCQLIQNQTVLLDVPRFAFMAHQITLITGDNGIGKSTLFKALTRLRPIQGQVTYEQQPIRKMRLKKYLAHVALVFQDAEMQFIDITVEEEIQLSLQHAHHHYYTPNDIDAMLTALNLAGRDQQVVYTLSEGQKKKLQIIVMLIMGPEVLLMDEPFKGLDLQSVQAVVQLLKHTQQQFHQTMIIISHQLSGLESLFDYHVEFKAHQLTYKEHML